MYLCNNNKFPVPALETKNFVIASFRTSQLIWQLCYVSWSIIWKPWNFFTATSHMCQFFCANLCILLALPPLSLVQNSFATIDVKILQCLCESTAADDLSASSVILSKSSLGSLGLHPLLHIVLQLSWVLFLPLHLISWMGITQLMLWTVELHQMKVFCPHILRIGWQLGIGW